MSKLTRVMRLIDLSRNTDGVSLKQIRVHWMYLKGLPTDISGKSPLSSWGHRADKEDAVDQVGEPQDLDEYGEQV